MFYHIVRISMFFLLFQVLFITHVTLHANNLFAYNQPPSKYALETFHTIKDALHVPMNEIAIAANPYVPNAMATIVPQPGGFDFWGRPILRPVKFILYNPNFMTQMEITTGSKWAGISIIAHEIGHHLGNHIISNNPMDYMRHPWEKELEADYYSGKALAILGAAPNDLQKAQRQMFTMWGSYSHPDTVRRIQRINQGWKDGGGKENIETELTDIWQEMQSELTKWYN